MFRKCIGCEKTFTAESFPICNKKPGGLIIRRARCNDCWNFQRKERKRLAAKWFRDYKRSKKCEICGNEDHRCLEFHHRNPAEKDFEIARMVINQFRRSAILAELAKCIPICANCHRILHYEEKKNRRLLETDEDY